METSGSKEYQLIYKGPKDESAETLRWIKSAFVVDLSLSIEETKRIIEQFPCVILESDSREELAKYHSILEKAGANTAILTPHKQDEEDGETTELLEQDDTFWEPEREAEENVIPHGDEASAETFEIELDFSGALTDPYQEEQSAKVYDLTENASAPAQPAFSLQDESATETNSPSPEPQKVAHTEQESTMPPADASKASDDESVGSSEALFSLEEISKALEESQRLDEENGAALQSSIQDAASEEPDLTFSFDDDPVVTKKKSSESPEKKNASSPQESAAQFDTPEIEVEEEAALSVDQDAKNKVQLPSQAPEVAGDKAAMEEKSAEVDASAPMKLAAIGARRSKEAQATAFAQAEPVAEEIPYRVRNGSAPSALLQIIVPLVLFGTLLGIANWYYFTQTAPKVPDKATPGDTDREKDNSQGESAATEEQKPLKMLFQGEKKFADRTVSAQFSTEAGVIRSFSVEFTTPPPPALTAEQLARGEKRTPWLSKIVVDALPLAQEGELEFSAQGPAKGYIEDGKTNYRVIGTATVKGTWNKDKTVIHSTTTVIYNPEGKEMPDDAILLRSGEKGVRFQINGSVAAQGQR